MTESDPNTAKVQEDKSKAAKPDKKAELNAVGQREPEHEQPVQPHHPDKPVGERQDGPGVAPPRPERHDALPAGATGDRRRGADQGQPEEPDAAHRGQPAGFRTGEAQGSGASAGGTAVGQPEDLDAGSKGGAGREQGFTGAKP